VYPLQISLYSWFTLINRMYENLTECPSCTGTAFIDHLTCEDKPHTREKFKIVRCRNCQLLFTNPRPNKHGIGRFYEHNDYISHTNASTNVINSIYKLARRYTLYKTGVFLNYIGNKGYTVAGLEPSEEARNIAQTLNPKITIHEDLTQIGSNQYDVITAWHVLEHVHDIKRTLITLRESLAPQGTIIAAVPNINSYDCQYYGEDWAAYDVPRHLYHFDQDTFQTLAKRCELNVVAINPMKLDSYYVSLLSEKYLARHGRIKQIIKAITIGKKTNTQASKTKDYSSLIYVLKP